MPVEFTYRCTLPSGLHARPCSHIAAVAGRFRAEASLTNQRTGRTANLKSVLSLISASVLEGDGCLLVFAGEDDADAADAVKTFIENEMATLEEPVAAPVSGKRTLPRMLRVAGIEAAFGMPLSTGFGRGKLRVAVGIRLPELGSGERAGDLHGERRKMQRAITELRKRFQEMARESSRVAAAIVTAQCAILDDVLFSQRLSVRIDQGNTAGDAIILTAREFAETLAKSESAYIRERAIDVQEVSLRLFETIYGAANEKPLELDADTVLVAEDLGAQELLKLPRPLLKGIVFGEGQATSHAAILARTLGIPAISGAEEINKSFPPGSDVFLDGTRGYVVGETSATQKFYGREQAVYAKLRGELEHYRMSAGATGDGRPMEVAANVSSAEEAEAAFANGCDGIGLFRTEMMFVGRGTAPTEEEQFSAYDRAARAGKAAGNKTSILRTFDAGGDKPVRFLPAPTARDSALGDRGILIYKEHREVLQAQLRAMLRASAEGPLRIMFPLISTVEELLWLRAQVDAAKQSLTAQGQAFDPQVQIGIMIELPDAVPNLAELAGHADFFSIGTNDLAQYFFAQDRTRSKLDLRANVRHPEFLRLLREISRQAQQTKTWLGMCGEMAGDPINLALLVGLGLDEVSMGGDVLAMKARLAKLHSAACIELLEKAVGCSTVEEVNALLATFAAQGDADLTDQKLVIVDSISSTREDAIRELTDILYIYGRTGEPDQLEDAIWEREATYPTDMGLGFALPHCKSSAVLQSSVALLRPVTPFLWSEESTVPVRLVIMLAMKEEGAEHMQVLARLARKLMDEEFRERLLGFTDPSAAKRLLDEAGVN